MKELRPNQFLAPLASPALLRPGRVHRALFTAALGVFAPSSVGYAAGSPPPPATAASSAPLTLSEALETALHKNPQAASAAATAAAVAARVGQARSAWLPQVSIGGSVRGDYSYQSGTSADRESARTFRYSSQLQLNQLIYDFGRTGGRIAAAGASAQAASEDADTVRAQVALSVVTSFFGVLQAEALHEVALRNMDQQRQRQLQADSFFRIGTKPEIDVLIAKTAVSQAELQLTQARNNILLARTQLVQALGVPEEDWQQWLTRSIAVDEHAPPSLEQSSPQIPGQAPAVPDQMLDETLKQRPDYQSLRQRMLQAEQQVRVAKGDYLPQLSLGATAGVSGLVNTLDIPNGAATNGLASPTHGEPALSLGGSLSLTWPLFNGLQTVYAVREAEAQLRVSRANLEVMRLQVRSQLQQALIQIQNARESVQAALSLQFQADKQQQMASGRYKAGVGNAIELGDSQISATSARAQRVNAEYSLALARANLQWQLGQLVPRQSRPSSDNTSEAPRLSSQQP